ncbi:MAG TPA: M48 family metallopeptidase [Planctomycetota bacterium]|nr:M48 family metallopeptidase [Planctomycetota bacterium]
MFELIRANKIKSWILILGLTSVLVVLGLIIGEVVAPGGGGIVGVAIAVVIAAFMNLLAYYGGGSMVLAMSAAKEIEHKDSPQLFNVVEEMSIAAGIPMPKVYLIDDMAMNAFATGRDPQHAAVAITKGLLVKLNRDELQGVMAHEMSHVKNRDMLYMTLAVVLVGTVVLLADLFLRGMWYSGAGGRRRRSSRDQGGAQAILIIIGIIVAILAPLIARLLYLACSRRREYLADASAAALTRYPEGLASALEKLSGDREILETANRATAHLYIVHPVRSLEEKASAMMSTHPPIQERIAILRNMGHTASMGDYQTAWQRYHQGQRLASAKALAGAPPPLPVRAAAGKPSSQETKEDRLRRAHGALDTFRRLGGFLFLACACGTKLKIPPGYTRGKVKCPRCGAEHDVAEAKEAAAETAEGTKGTKGT